MKSPLQFDQKAVKLLEVVAASFSNEGDLTKYISFVLQSMYEDGYNDAIYKVVEPTSKLPVMKQGEKHGN